MDVETNTPALEAQRKAHPDLGEALDRIEGYASQKLYHQLTDELLRYLTLPPFTKAAAAGELHDFFEGFIKAFEAKFDKITWVQLLAIICKQQTPEKALALIEPFEASVVGHRDAKYMWQALKAEKLIVAGKAGDAKELLETVGAEIEAAYEVDALIQSHFHKTNALLWKALQRPQAFYKSSILYLAFTPLASIPVEERSALAFEIGVASLCAEEEFNFSELLQQELLASIEGSHKWIMDLLQSFGEGKLEMFDDACAKNRANIDATPELKAAEEKVLKPKIRALALMELAFRKPKKQRRLTFDEISQHCKVAMKEVEYLVMKAMCADLVHGKIDEVGQFVMITWVKPRILDTARVDLMRGRMDVWSEQTALLSKHLEEMTPELLVS